MAGQIFGSVIAGLVVIGVAHAGKRIVILNSAEMFAELYAIEELCPTVKIDLDAVAQAESRNLMDVDTLQWVLAEGRRRSPIEVARFAGSSAAEVCEYGWKRYGRYITKR
jgi:hypothetical protein